MTQLLRAFLLLLALATPALAQTNDAPSEPVQGPSQEVIVIGPPPPEIGKPFPDFDAWRRVAQRGERMTEVDVASLFAFRRLRADLVSWRDTFLDEINRNSERVDTVTQQLAALGPAPEDGVEDAAITARRSELTDLQLRLTSPSRMAQEAYARADGLIREVDSLIRNRETARLMEPGPTPLNPAGWPAAVTALREGVAVLVAEARAGLRSATARGTLARNLPTATLLFAAALGLLIWGRGLMIRMQDNLRRDYPFVATALSPAQMALPLLGIYLLVQGIDTLAIFGFRSSGLIAAIPLAGIQIVLARFLIGQFFPPGATSGLLGFDAPTRRRGARFALLLAWTAAFGTLLTALIDSGDVMAGVKAMINFPVIALLTVLLYALGRTLCRPQTGPDARHGRVRVFVGRACQAAAVASLLLAVAGYAIAAEALIFPMIITLSVLGLGVYLQAFLTDLYGTGFGRSDELNTSLVPVLIGLTLICLALPVLALAWGAGTNELTEIWTRFRDGFQVGDTRLSPLSLLALLVVFSVGYLLTRFIQGTLRTSVLPRTRFDIGAQNALVAGFGYVGIFLAALVAITSAGIDLSNLALVAGALSVGIGFGLQNIVQNFVSGIILLIERPISEGDMIEAGGQMGYVRDISVRSTRIETFDRTDVIIPNADLVSGTVTNWTRGNAVGRLILPVGVAYGSDVDKVKTILQEVAEAHPMVLLDPPPQVFFVTFGASSLDFEIRAILRDIAWKLVTQSEMNFEINARFAAAGIEIPFPQQDVWLRNPEKLRNPDST